MNKEIDQLIYIFNKTHLKTPQERLQDICNKKFFKIEGVSMRRQKKNRRKMIKKLEKEIKDEIRRKKLFLMDEVLFHFNQL